MAAAHAFIQCRVTPQVKALLRSLALREGLTESALIKRLLGVMLPASSSSVLEIPHRPLRDRRLCVRLERGDRLLLQERARARRVPSATYVAVLVRSHLRDLTPLPKEELLALRRAVAELSALGRNLNQIARAVHSGERVAGPDREDLKTMLRVAAALRDHVKALLLANAKAWKVGYAVD